MYSVFNINQLVKKLIGKNIRPVGETDEDRERFNSLREYSVLIEDFLADMINAIDKDSPKGYYSIDRSNKHIYQSLNDFKNIIDKELNQDNYYYSLNCYRGSEALPESKNIIGIYKTKEDAEADKKRLLEEQGDDYFKGYELYVCKEEFGLEN